MFSTSEAFLKSAVFLWLPEMSLDLIGEPVFVLKLLQTVKHLINSNSINISVRTYFSTDDSPMFEMKNIECVKIWKHLPGWQMFSVAGSYHVCFIYV